MTEHEERPRISGSDRPADVSIPDAIEARASRVRRIVAGSVALLVFASVPAVGLSRFASADEDLFKETKHELQQSKHELHKAKDKYRAQRGRSRSAEVMNRLATRIASRGEILQLEPPRQAPAADDEASDPRGAAAAKLDERSREAMSGSVPISTCTATSRQMPPHGCRSHRELRPARRRARQEGPGDDRSHRADRGRGRAGPPDRRAQEAKP
jgi:hypothetical protein